MVTLILQVAGFLPPKYGVPLQAIGNIVIRLFTDQPVTVLPKS